MIQEHQATGPSLSLALSYNPSPTVLYPERVSSAQFHFITSDNLPGVWLQLVLRCLPVPPRHTPTPSRLVLDHASHPSVSSKLSLALSHSPITYPAAMQPSLTPRKGSSSPQTEDDRMRYSAVSTIHSLTV
ncbi:hypothetical protein BT96DRAFT_994510 [Gymnopus androsaceus JB14]|uniref:Uncharacterized protein n=1 Tax=Gymnopus androsaceus JB14 TaxID=1447944 RepID=A0A6A4HL10_9AGAR|nr:hypothetical protein BT96DRAFT_994510 [Gymnopus androsaceus JB14]